MNWKHVASTALAVSLVAGIASTASAQLIAADSYNIGPALTDPNSRASLANGEYPLNANGAEGTRLINTAALGAQNAALNATPAPLVTPGFQNGATNGGTGTANFAATTGGLSSASLGVVAGAGSGKVTYTGSTVFNANRSTSRTLSPAAPVSATYWTSIIIERAAVSLTGLDLAMVGFGGSAFPVLGGTAGAGSAGLYMGFAGDTGNIALRYRNNAVTGAVFTETTLRSGTLVNSDTTGPYTLITKIDFNVGGSVTDNITYWLNPVSAASEAALNLGSLATGTITNGNVLSVNTDLARLNYYARNWDGNVNFDEIRLGTTLASVAPGAVAVPEPGTIALLGLGGVALLGMVRRRRAA